MSKKSLLLLEIIWTALGVICLVIAVRETLRAGTGHSWLFMVMAVIAFGLARLRHVQRKKL